MKTRLQFLLLFIQLFEACAEVIFQRLTEDRSLVLSCTPQQERGHLVGLHLYHRGPRSQTTLLSVAEGSTVRRDPERRARLQLSGGLNSPRINVSISHLQLSDTGLYMWELSYRQKNSSDQVVLGAQRYFLLVEGAGRSCGCSHGYIPLLLTISAAAGLLLLTVSLLAMEKCVRLRHHRPPQPHSPIYEEMSRKQQSAGSPRITHEASPQPEEVRFPVYANPSIRQPQDNYYACPRQLAVRV
ncbi:uncharacterized protein LOC106960132 isoform X1 [Poecilia latipinna]|uniref:uncharacterized protein LOC106960132 isoform X1 n=1 Tax=Poecilia latipinna TaxID=48699 RepID=UPI00072E4925|nr:PREDICTED: uncharacterized protein LOC106960132 isoform X1 [Poecilia latipinna]